MANKTLVKQYKKERGRIQRQINRMKKRGYTFSEQVLPAIPKRITLGSINRLAKITTPKLYKLAEFTTPSGEVIMGTAGRVYERKHRKPKKERVATARPEALDRPTVRELSDGRWMNNETGEIYDYSDIENRIAYNPEQGTLELYDVPLDGSEPDVPRETDIVMDNMNSMFELFEEDAPDTVQFLKKELEQVIIREGKEQVTQRLKGVSEGVTYYISNKYEGGDYKSHSLYAIYRQIRGKPLTASNAKKLQSYIDSDGFE